MVVFSEDLHVLLRKSQISKLSGCCAGPVDFVQSYGIQYESEKPLSGITIGFFPQKISVKSVTNMVKDCTKASGPQVCWQTIAGH